jgi:hypothetical protein
MWKDNRDINFIFNRRLLLGDWKPREEQEMLNHWSIEHFEETRLIEVITLQMRLIQIESIMKLIQMNWMTVIDMTQNRMIQEFQHFARLTGLCPKRPLMRVNQRKFWESHFANQWTFMTTVNIVKNWKIEKFHPNHEWIHLKSLSFHWSVRTVSRVSQSSRWYHGSLFCSKFRIWTTQFAQIHWIDF